WQRERDQHNHNKVFRPFKNIEVITGGGDKEGEGERQPDGQAGYFEGGGEFIGEKDGDGGGALAAGKNQAPKKHRAGRAIGDQDKTAGDRGPSTNTTGVGVCQGGHDGGRDGASRAPRQAWEEIADRRGEQGHGCSGRGGSTVGDGGEEKDGVAALREILYDPPQTMEGLINKLGANKVSEKPTLACAAVAIRLMRLRPDLQKKRARELARVASGGRSDLQVDIEELYRTLCLRFGAPSRKTSGLNGGGNGGAAQDRTGPPCRYPPPPAPDRCNTPGSCPMPAPAEERTCAQGVDG
ncbi:unnamed protein product, partial [Discosporangium mesarthrocarpum]